MKIFTGRKKLYDGDQAVIVIAAESMEQAYELCNETTDFDHYANDLDIWDEWTIPTEPGVLLMRNF